MRRKRENRGSAARRGHGRRPDADERVPAQYARPDDPDDLREGRDFYGYNFGDYRQFEGSDPDADDDGGRGPEWDDEEAWGYEDRGASRYEGSDIRGYEGRAHRNYGGGYEGYYGEWEGRDPDEYESWRWGPQGLPEPVGEWSSRHSREHERPGFGRRRARGRAHRGGRGRPAQAGGPRRRRVQRSEVGESPRGEQPRRRRSFRGIPPKGYTRSDSSIYEEVCALLEDADVDPSNVTVSVDEREVVLSGTIEDRWAKRYAEDLAYSVRGVSDVINKLRVEPREAEGGGGLTSAPESRSMEDVPDAAQ